jgi:hypothetical protein
MWHGDKVLDESASASRDDLKTRSLALLVLLVAVLLVASLVSLGN